ncbi:TetR/AcrR family transcriptional regulator [Acetobacteraceae bacterium H6797]|nr:TetR/AcrR family transcriptional regulator [Acetobacteraceae bacterium H6797]
MDHATRRRPAGRAELLEAASAVFSEQGITAPLEAVRERAGVGRATLYRHFPDREALVIGLVELSLERLEAHAAETPADADAFQHLLHQLTHELARNPAVMDAWRVVKRDLALSDALRNRFMAVFLPSLSMAIETGAVRPDLSAEDLPLVAGMLGALVREPDRGSRDALVGRVTDLLLSGLRHRERAARPAKIMAGA